MGQKRTLPAAVRMFGWGRERSSHFESVLLGAPHVPERAGCDADNGMRMMVATRAKPDEIVPELSVQKRSSCIALRPALAGARRRHACDRANSCAASSIEMPDRALQLTRLGRDVLTELLKD